MASQPGPQTRPASATQTQTTTTPEQTSVPPVPILRLRGGHASRRRVQWTEDVVDNEKLNRKRSKVCCIYHRPKAVDESSDESSGESSDESSDSDTDRDPKNSHSHDCPGHGHNNRHSIRPRKRADGEKKERRPSPNAYERVPKGKGRMAREGGGAESKSKT